MQCGLCRTEFCWLCLSPWQDHAICGQRKVQVQVEFKKERKNKSSSKSASRYEDSLLHRQKRSVREKKEMLGHVKRLLETVKFEDSIQHETERVGNVSKTERLVELGNIHSEKRKELRKFLEDVVAFLNELHFICEYSYVLLRDYSIDREARNFVSNLVKSFEIVSWRIENNLAYGKSVAAVDELRELYNKGLKYIQMLKNVKINS